MVYVILKTFLLLSISIISVHSSNFQIIISYPTKYILAYVTYVHVHAIEQIV